MSRYREILEGLLYIYTGILGVLTVFKLFQCDLSRLRYFYSFQIIRSVNRKQA